MGKYQEICRILESKRDSERKAINSFTETFTSKLAQFMECPAQLIELKFSPAKVFENIIHTDFKVSISFEMDGQYEDIEAGNLKFLFLTYDNPASYFVSHNGITYSMTDDQDSLFGSVCRELEEMALTLSRDSLNPGTGQSQESVQALAPPAASFEENREESVNELRSLFDKPGP